MENLTIFKKNSKSLDKVTNRIADCQRDRRRKAKKVDDAI